MGRVFGVHGGPRPWLGRAVQRLALRSYRKLGRKRSFFQADSDHARERAASFRRRLEAGETVYLLGLAPGGHNTSVALVRASRAAGVELLANHEEERFTGVKHCAAFPVRSLAALREQMAGLGIGPGDLHACLASWDFVHLIPHVMRMIFEGAPRSLGLLRAKGDVRERTMGTAVPEAAAALGRELGLDRPFPIVGLRHHDNHAWFAWGVSPFAGSPEPVMIAVLDGSGDDGAVSLYLARGRELELVSANDSSHDSLGGLYGVVSSTQGGWPLLSSEGRYMGAAAWGDGDRLTNPYYMRLRQLLWFGKDGEFRLNRALARWPETSVFDPYQPELADVLGPPIPPEKLWDPDAVLDVDDVRHAEITRERVDKAAALQLLFEDALLHVVGALVRRTGSERLVLTGGCALNCVANMRLLERFDERFYAHHLGRPGARLRLWVPPVPNDAGAALGAAYHFALANGAPPGPRLEHAFWCGRAATGPEIAGALAGETGIGVRGLGDVATPEGRSRVADLLASIVSSGGVVGLFQGVAETGPRALGHRSILADPRNPRTLEVLNALVKRRERIRPLAPMATLEEARRLFDLSPGAADDDHNAYNYMILTARARPEACAGVPAAVHRDGTARVQIVRRHVDPFTHAFLEAMKRRTGFGVAVNTSLNVGSPIVQTPAQAAEVLRRAKGMHGILFLGAGGEALVAWHDVVAPPKDAGAALLAWIDAWERTAGNPAAHG